MERPAAPDVHKAQVTVRVPAQGAGASSISRSSRIERMPNSEGGVDSEYETRGGPQGAVSWKRTDGTRKMRASGYLPDARILDPQATATTA